jgi:hypothetical protein
LRWLTLIVPIVSYFLTYRICKELQALPSAGKRKVVNVVRMTEEGEYIAIPVAPPDEVAHRELDAEPVPELIEDDAPVEAVPARAASRGDAGNVGTSSVRTVPR